MIKLVLKKQIKGQVKYSLKYDKEKNIIKIHNYLTLLNIPSQCKNFTLDIRFAVDCVLEFYKPSKNDYTDQSLI